MKNLFAPFREEREKKTDERLSAYLDGALSPRERKRLEAELAQDPQLRARLEALRRTVALVRTLPPVRAPRNFILTPAMVEGFRPAPARPVARPLSPVALTFATALSGLVCILLLMGNLLSAGWGVPGAAAPVPVPAYKAGTDLVTATAAVAETPPQETPPPEPAGISEAQVEEMPHPLESAPPGLGGVGGGGGIGGGEIGGGWEPGPSETPSGGGEMGAFSAAPQAPTPTAALRALVREETPTPEPTPVPLPAPATEPGASAVPSFLPWLPVGGMALLTLALAVLTARAWRAR